MTKFKRGDRVVCTVDLFDRRPTSEYPVNPNFETILTCKEGTTGTITYVREPCEYYGELYDVELDVNLGESCGVSPDDLNLYIDCPFCRPNCVRYALHVTRNGLEFEKQPDRGIIMPPEDNDGNGTIKLITDGISRGEIKINNCPICGRIL